MKTLSFLPVDCPFALAIEADVSDYRSSFTEDDEQGDVDYFVEGREDDLVREALRAHDLHETWLALTEW